MFHGLILVNRRVVGIHVVPKSFQEVHWPIKPELNNTEHPVLDDELDDLDEHFLMYYLVVCVCIMFSKYKARRGPARMNFKIS